MRLKELDPKAESMVQRLEELNQLNKELSQKLARAEAEAKRIEGQFLKLKEDSAGVLGLRGEYQKLKQEMAKRSEHLDEMSAELESLRFGNNLKWFLGRGRRFWSSGGSWAWPSGGASAVGLPACINI